MGNIRMKRKDSELLARIGRKDRKAFDAFYDRYIRLIYCFVFRELHDEQLVDDLIQDFWMKVWEDPQFLRCREDGSVKVFMLQYFRFRIFDLYRKTMNSQKLISQQEELEGMADIFTTITEKSEVDELVRIIHEALAKQSSLVRNVFWLRVNDWSVEETAKSLSVSSKTVYNRYSESLVVIRQHICQHYPEFAYFRRLPIER